MFSEFTSAVLAPVHWGTDKARVRIRIKELRLARGLTQGELADMIGTSTQSVHRLEQGKQPLTTEWMELFASALDVPVTDLIADPPTVPIEGFIEGGQTVKKLDVGKLADAPPLPESGPVALLRAVEVRDDSLWPAYRRGDLLYYRTAEQVDESCIGRDCVVEAETGEQLIAQVLPGSAEPGHYRLRDFRSPSDTETSLAWAAPIIWIHRQ